MGDVGGCIVDGGGGGVWWVRFLFFGGDLESRDSGIFVLVFLICGVATRGGNEVSRTNKAGLLLIGRMSLELWIAHRSLLYLFFFWTSTSVAAAIAVI